MDDFETVERYLGKTVHSSLERLYLSAMDGDLMGCDELLYDFDDEWDKGDPPAIVINKEGATLEEYRLMGSQCLTSYYYRHAPLTDCRTVACELKVNIDLLGDGKYMFLGFIDRIDRIGDGRYEIHDYKTGAKPLSQNRADSDLQLALYELGIRQRFASVKDVGYVWHFLRHDLRIRSFRTNEGIGQMKSDLVSSIHAIDEAIVEDFFPYLKTPRCAWCEFQTICSKEEGRPMSKQTRLS